MVVSVNAFSAGDERNTQTVQLVNHLQEMSRTPRYAVERRNEHDFESLLPCVCHQRVQTRTPRSPSRNPTILIDLDHLKGTPRSKLPQVVKLRFNVLVGGGDTNVNGGGFH